MRTVMAKFRCDSVENQPSCEQKNVTLRPVTSGSDENKSFAKYTPSGLLQLSISYETPAVDYFNPGDEYYLNIQKVD
ncbi:MAG TPA: hypothetical protein PKC47_14280 [Petrimonas sp.]|nr:hypothetical protein [Petrimonas sp.]